jgi:hypothetical protein
MMFVMLATTLAAAGCSKVSLDNYDKVETGMTQSEVEAILGAGNVENGGGASIGDISLSGKILSWGSGKQQIKVTFANGKVISKSQSGL